MESQVLPAQEANHVARVLQRLVEGTQHTQGTAFLESIAVELSVVLEADYVLIGELMPEGRSVHTVAVTVNGALGEPFTYDLDGTPCEEVADQNACTFSCGVAQQFPRDQLLADMGVQGYTGVPLVDASGRPLGIMAALFREPIKEPGFAQSILEIFADRCAAEIEQERLTEAAQRADNILRAVAAAAGDLLSTADWRTTVLDVLRRLADAASVDRIQIFERGPAVENDDPDEARVSRRYSWERDDVQLPLDPKYMYEVPLRQVGFGRWVDLLGRGEPVVGMDHEFPEGERQVLAQKGIRSLLVIPIQVEGRWWGQLGVSDCTVSRRWSDAEIEAFGAAARMLGAAIQRQAAVEREESLRQQVQTAQKMESIGRLASGVAHDFNNVLAAIMGHTEIAKLLAQENSVLEDELQQIVLSTRRAAALTRQLLIFARKQVTVPKVVDLPGIVDGIIKMIRRLLPEDVDLSTCHHDGSLFVLADPSQVEQVLLNLVVNARDAMPEGGSLSIETRRWKPEQSEGVDPCPWIELEVRDTGTGMSPETAEHAFEPFFTTKREGRGTGLGLATCFGIAKQIGGDIQIRTALGEGTSFFVRLPLTQKTAEVEQKKLSEKMNRGHGETLLLAEDDPSIRGVLCRILGQAGYRVLAAADGQEALELGHRHLEDVRLVVSDVVMPRVCGGALAAELRRRRPDLPILFLSGHHDDTLTQHGFPLGEVQILAKPFSSEELLDAVRNRLA